MNRINFVVRLDYGDDDGMELLELSTYEELTDEEIARRAEAVCSDVAIKRWENHFCGAADEEFGSRDDVTLFDFIHSSLRRAGLSVKVLQFFFSTSATISEHLVWGYGESPEPNDPGCAICASWVVSFVVVVRHST